MSQLLRRTQVSYPAIAECLAISGFAAVSACLSFAGPTAISAQIAVTVIFLAGMLCLAWVRFDGGMHPAFLFLGMLFLFQGGRLLCSMLGIGGDPLRVDIQTPAPFDLTGDTKAMTMFLLTLSATCIYMSARLSYRRRQFVKPDTPDLTFYIFVIFVVTFPFHFYKNYSYISYLWTHGGYLALYTSNGEYVEDIGLTIRVLSQVCSAAFLLYFIRETRKWCLLAVSVPYFAVTVIELLMGLRGKVFLLFLSFLYLHKLKTGGRFKLYGLLVLTTTLAVIGLSVAIFRENKADSFPNPLLFFWGQGVSIDVTAMAIQFYDHFSSHASSYLWYQVMLAFRHTNTFGLGQLFPNDLSVFLNPEAFKAGFATGSSYLAEAYLLAKVPGVVVVSLGVGLALSVLNSVFRRDAAAFATVLTMNLIYWPRDGIILPFINSGKEIIALTAVLIASWIAKEIVRIIGDNAHASEHTVG